MREAFAAVGEDLIVLGFLGELSLVDGATEKIGEGQYKDLEAFGPYEVTRELMFQDEYDEQNTGQQHG
jgi:hypothetical protein